MALSIKNNNERSTVYDIHVQDNHNFFANDILVHNCTEIIEVTNQKEIAVCNLGSVNLVKYVIQGTEHIDDVAERIDWSKLAKNIKIAITNLDAVIDINFYPVDKAKESNSKWRPIGFGVMGFHFMLLELGLSYEHPKTADLNKKLFAFIYYHALQTSVELAKKFGPFERFDITKTGKFGKLQFDLWDITNPEEHHGMDWNQLRADIKTHGLRNSLVCMIAPTATTASMIGTSESIEPMVANISRRETLSGDFVQINSYLVNDLRKQGLWTDAIKDAIIVADGSIQGIQGIPQEIKDRYKTAWETPMRALIDLAADRGPYVDQSQSLNLYQEAPSIGKLSSMYMYAWKRGLKTSYYLRSRAATGIKKVIATAAPDDQAAAIACSLENPEACEMCT